MATPSGVPREGVREVELAAYATFSFAALMQCSLSIVVPCTRVR
jgi:hypothetical protein